MSVKNIGRGVTNPRVNRPTAIRTAHEAAGVIFIDQNGGGPGVRLRKAQTSLG
ncbi:XRE family transcriptional regulator [Mesorhizobium sp. Root552]|uniref:XRE family transcriptional regulator n=1 Tax=Mesorhizobium sp. Root552 TaxID=1736555 RepID=UPI001910D7BF|nr:XRE family transcriptional regulator [Mesorhizobium sp. Root552]